MIWYQKFLAEFTDENIYYGIIYISNYGEKAEHSSDSLSRVASPSLKNLTSHKNLQEALSWVHIWCGIEPCMQVGREGSYTRCYGSHAKVIARSFHLVMMTVDKTRLSHILCRSKYTTCWQHLHFPQLAARSQYLYLPITSPLTWNFEGTFVEIYCYITWHSWSFLCWSI